MILLAAAEPALSIKNTEATIKQIFAVCILISSITLKKIRVSGLLFPKFEKVREFRGLTLEYADHEKE
ncbi:MAG: hypothetical protein AB3K77_14615 [Methanosarcinaceae archaeon]